MKIRLLAVGQGMPTWVRQGYEEYAKRLGRDLRLELVEIAAGHRGKSADLQRTLREEGQALLAARRAQDHLVALAIDGQAWSTPDLTEQLRLWQGLGRDVCLAVGGPDGLSEAVLSQAGQRWSLSALTLPHPMVRVIVAEQIYRAWTLLQGHPYHR